MNDKSPHLLVELKKKIKQRSDNRWYIIFKFDVVPLLRKTDNEPQNPLLQELVVVAQKRKQPPQPSAILDKELQREIIKFDHKKLKHYELPTQSWWEYFSGYIY